MYRTAPPTRVYALVLAVVSGVLLATGRVTGGVVCACIAVAFLAAWLFGGDDHQGLY